MKLGELREIVEVFTNYLSKAQYANYYSILLAVSTS